MVASRRPQIVVVVDQDLRPAADLGVAEGGRPFAEGEVRGDDDGALLVEPADQVEEQLSSGLCEGQIAKFVEDDEVHACEIIRPCGPGGRRGLRP